IGPQDNASATIAPATRPLSFDIQASLCRVIIRALSGPCPLRPMSSQAYVASPFELRRLRLPRSKRRLENACVVFDCKLLNSGTLDLPPLPVVDHASQVTVVGDHSVGPQTVHIGAKGHVVLAKR